MKVPKYYIPKWPNNGSVHFCLQRQSKIKPERLLIINEWKHEGINMHWHKISFIWRYHEIDSISVLCFWLSVIDTNLYSVYTWLLNLEIAKTILKLTSTRHIGMCKIVYLNIKACGIYVYMYQSYTRPWLDRSIWLINLNKEQSIWVFIYTAPYLHDYNTANAQFESWNERKNSHETWNLHNYIEWNNK